MNSPNLELRKTSRRTNLSWSTGESNRNSTRSDWMWYCQQFVVPSGVSMYGTMPIEWRNCRHIILWLFSTNWTNSLSEEMRMVVAGRKEVSGDQRSICPSVPKTPDMEKYGCSETKKAEQRRDRFKDFQYIANNEKPNWKDSRKHEREQRHHSGRTSFCTRRPYKTLNILFFVN